MIVLDASVLIAHLDARDAHHVAAGAILASAAGEALLGNPLTVAEVLVAPARAGRAAEAKAALDALGVEVVALPADAPVRLAVLRADTGLRLPDCCVLLTALDARAAVATFDARLAAAARSLGLDPRD